MRWVARRPWLMRLSWLFEMDPRGFPAKLLRALDESLRAEGKRGRTASRIALRQSRLVVMLLDGHEQRTAARALGVSERTAKYDVAHVRRVEASRKLGSPRV
jgi:hypothetical protein